MINANFNPFPVLTTGRLLLRKVEAADVHEIFILRSDPVVMKYSTRPPAQTLEEAAAFIRKIESMQNRHECINWAISLKDERRLLGTVCFWNIQYEHDRAEIGFVMLPAYFGKGIMQEAVTAALDYGFKIMHLHAVEAMVNPLNAPSIKLLERKGFIREGYFRENHYYEGRFLDTAVYSLLTPVA